MNNYQQTNFTPSNNLMDASPFGNPSNANQAQKNFNPFDF